MESDEILSRFCCIPLKFQSHLCLVLQQNELPKDWREEPAPLSTKQSGDQWVADKISVILEVPIVFPSRMVEKSCEEQGFCNILIIYSLDSSCQ